MTPTLGEPEKDQGAGDLNRRLSAIEAQLALANSLAIAATTSLFEVIMAVEEIASRLPPDELRDALRQKSGVRSAQEMLQTAWERLQSASSRFNDGT
ncbi:MAG: hypothetical protein O9325_05980 [Roseomonas sp.]|nr:hypothetical protein [Roseomonas sp.]